MGFILLIAGIVLGGALWSIVAHHRKANEEFVKQRFARENAAANAAAEAERAAEESRLNSLTDEELDAEFALDSDEDAEQAERDFAAVQADIDAVVRDSRT